MLAGTDARKVAVVVDESPAGAEERARAIGASVIQLHGQEDPRDLEELRARGPWLLWKAVRARTAADVHGAVGRFRGVAHGILVEGWKRGVVGGGGARLRVQPEEVRAAVPREVDFVLAGGLDPQSVAEAVALFLPDVVDVSSGVEAGPRRKDPELLRAFLRRARAAARATEGRGDERTPGGRHA